MSNNLKAPKGMMGAATNHRDVAENIAERLFVNGQGTEAHRLVLMSIHGSDLGGWCKQAVVDQIVCVLKDSLPEVRG